MPQKYELVNEWGSEGDDDGQFVRPHDLDFSPTEDKLYIVDRDNNRIQVFDKNGTFLFKWGEEGEGDGEFTLPYGLDVDKEGNVWVADRGNNRIQKLMPKEISFLPLDLRVRERVNLDNLDMSVSTINCNIYMQWTLIIIVSKNLTSTVALSKHSAR